MQRFFVERITDVSNDLCAFVDDPRNKITDHDLIRLYEYHFNNNHIHPLTNWHAHRIRCMSSIAVRLQDQARIRECHRLVLEYYSISSECDCHCTDKNTGALKAGGVNHDFYHRDSLNYLVYGAQAMANACLYLRPTTRFDYYTRIFEPIVRFLDPFVTRKRTRLEFVNSEIASDRSRPEYGKPWNPSYANTFLRLVESLRAPIPTNNDNNKK